jgi:formiminoglutamase
MPFMSANYIQESNKRSLMTLKNHQQKNNAKSWMLCADSDLGTIHNFGRRGSQYGSAGILTQLKKMAYHEQSPFHCQQVSSYLDEKIATDFNQAQKNECINIGNAFNNPLVNQFFHLGGGHDHILPLLLALQEANPQK